MIGGTGADILRGGFGADILIEGTTEHDDNRRALRRIMREWTRTDISYAKRIDHLQNGGGRNGKVRLNSDTIDNDAAVDQLFGQFGRDWFLSPLPEVQDLGLGEQVN